MAYGASLRTEIRSDLAVFDELDEWWNSQEGPRRWIFLRTEWLRTWAEAFVHSARELHVLVIHRAGQPVAAVPMFRDGRVLKSMRHSDSGGWDMIWDGSAESAQLAIEALDRFPATVLRDMGDDSPLVTAAVGRPGWRIREHDASPYVDLTLGAEQVMAQMSRNLRQNIRKGDRRLEGLGNINTVMHPPQNEIADLVAKGLDLEASGWKGEGGSPVLRRERKNRFWSAFTEIAAERGWVRPTAMFHQDQMIAFWYLLEYANRIYAVLTGYDETLGSYYSPGRALLVRAMEDAAHRGLATLELGRMGGGRTNWKTQWTDHSRPLVTVGTYGKTPTGLLLRGRRVAAQLWRGVTTPSGAA